MGKRELVLIVAFAVLGIVVYEFTAPPPLPGSEGFTIGGLIRNVRRGVRGPREMTSADSTQTAAVPAAVNELRLNISRTSDVTITGEDRTDIAASLHVTGHGFDATEAAAVAHGPHVQIETSGDTITVSLEMTGMPEGTQPRMPPVISLTLAVPKRLAVRAEPHIGHFFVTNVAALEASSSRGETRISSISGSLRLTHTAGTLEISSVGSVKLTARSSRGTVQNVRGETAIDGTGSELRLTGIAGPLEIEARNTDLTLEAGTELKAPLRVNMTGGQLRVRGLRIETRIDGRNADLSVALDAPAPVAIYNIGGIAVTAPPGGYTLDATATEGHVTVEDESVHATDGPDSHAEGQVRGGGPVLTLRATRGPIEVRKPEGK